MPDGKKEQHVKAVMWKCSSCQFLLGFLDKDDLTELRIKYKDLYVRVQGSKVTVTCRKCGKVNILEDEEFKLFLSSKKEFEEYLKKKGGE